LARKVKCPYCQEQLDKDEAVEHKKRYYHEGCFNTWRSEVDHRKELIEYICNMYDIESPTGMMLKQIKEYQDELGYKLKGMQLALEYFHETLGNPIREGDSIGIIPYIYEEAKKHYLTKMKAEESNEEIEKNVKVVRLKSPTLHTYKKVKPIDMGSL
jgi:molybdopterin converting factor small subunit